MLSLNTNLLARAATQNLKTNYSRLAVHVQRLSTGLRVNAAADDAAGLAIREMMRADVAALHQGARNANDAISLLQTADGALAVIDEKLIRMKELAEQAATGTYDSTQRRMIDNEFQAMGAEIDRIARSTDFNGIKLLDGSRKGAHDGSGMDSAGALKIHFGTANDSAEDYYYVEIGDCTLAGLGLAVAPPELPDMNGANSPGGRIVFADGSSAAVNDFKTLEVGTHLNPLGMPPLSHTPPGRPTDIQDVLWTNEWCWGTGTWTGFGFLHVIPAGTKNVMFNIMGTTGHAANVYDENGNLQVYENRTDGDIQLFTMNGTHLAGTPLSDASYDIKNYWARPGYNTGRPTEVSSIEGYSPWLGFTEAEYDDRFLNSGPAQYETGAVDNSSLNWSTYNGMTIGYSGDGNRNNDGNTQDGGFGYEVLTIDGEVTEDLLVWVPGGIEQIVFKMYWDGGPGRPSEWDEAVALARGSLHYVGGNGGLPASVATQESAQKTLTRIDDAIAAKDKVRAHIGAMQNRLENTVTNLNVQAENLQSAESRISDADVALEMMQFVRAQILTQAATAMVSQANALPQMLSGLLRA